MAGGFLEALGKLTVFVICAQMLVYFRPKQVYEKYLRLLMNLLILLQLLLPIGNFLRGGTELDLRAHYEAFQRRMEEYMEGTARRTYDRWGTEESGKLKEDLWKEDAGAKGGYLWDEEERRTGEGGEAQAEAPPEEDQNAPGPAEGMEAIERVEIPAVELGGKDEQ